MRNMRVFPRGSGTGELDVREQQGQGQPDQRDRDDGEEDQVQRVGVGGRAGVGRQPAGHERGEEGRAERGARLPGHGGGALDGADVVTTGGVAGGQAQGLGVEPAGDAEQQQEDGRHDDGERAIAEQAQGDDRVRRAALGEHEQHRQQHAGGGQAEDDRRGPGVGGAGPGGEQVHRDDRGGQEDDAEVVEAGLSALDGQVQPDRDDGYDEGAEGQVDQEDRAPAGQVGEQAADGRAGQGRLGDLMRDGRGVALDFGVDRRLRDPATGWESRIRYAAGAARDDLGAAAVLVRPDGVVAWAGDPDRAAFERAASRWFGRSASG
ncbi:hypothetical protein ACIBK9_11390 [Nonomuraea sp. NPDC050227]|uniref:aromatic-ring hydroxylase C-terminal domain-containing protein n=1 Tax=Nonomuraea sp. NPDC050227 TaxID=3364360 RepID=UPI00379149E3